MSLARQGKNYDEFYGVKSKDVKEKQSISRKEYLETELRKELPRIVAVLNLVACNKDIKMQELIQQTNTGIHFVRKCLRIIHIENFQKEKQVFIGSDEDWANLITERINDLKEKHIDG